jgi:glycosyltransferase involved in cell wall biosynthesis
LRIVLVYDCLYPHTVGGAERWYRSLAERLSERHEVTYLTRRQWVEGRPPKVPFRVVAVSPDSPLYTKSGRRRIWPTLRFGLGVFWHLLRHAGRYDVVHSASFPYFSLIGAWLALRVRRGGRLIADWHEVWSREYWRGYLVPLAGAIGYWVQRLCARLPDESFTFSRLHERRLREQGHAAPTTRLTGIYSGIEPGGAGELRDGARGEPLVVFAGRHIPEKGVTTLPDAIALARRTLPSLRCVIFGDGPERHKVVSRVHELGLENTIEVPGEAPYSEVGEAIGRAACMVLPSRREGYGLIVVEALAHGTPAVVVEAPDNAATELIEPGVNGVTVPSTEPATLAPAIVQVIERGEEMQRSTLAWFREHAYELSIESSLAAVEQAYATS